MCVFECVVCVLVVFVCKYAYAKLHAVLNSVAGQLEGVAAEGSERVASSEYRVYGLQRIGTPEHTHRVSGATKARVNNSN